MSVETSEELGELFSALAKAQATFGAASKDGTNPHLRSKYATLESVLQEVRPKLAAQGLSIQQHPVDRDGQVGVITILGHSSGQWTRSSFYGPPNSNRGTSALQAIGGGLSYLRRYALMSAVGISTADEDNDGHQERKRGKSKAPPKPKAPKQWTKSQQGAFFARLAELGVPYEPLAAWCEANGRPRPSAMVSEQRQAMVTYIERKTPEERASMWPEVTP